MIDMLKRHEIQVLRRAGHTWMEVARLSGVSVRTARRIAAERPSPRSITPPSASGGRSGGRRRPKGTARCWSTH